jgi:hypothetical protein
MTAATWWAAGLAVAVALMPCLVGPIRRAWAAGVRRRRARRRAEALLWTWLSPAQRSQYRRRRWFEVTTASGRRYRILRGAVVRLPRGSGYCIEATSPVPVADEMLANKLLLETNERRFLATAHRFPYRSFAASLPSDLGLRPSFGRATGDRPEDRRGASELEQLARQATSRHPPAVGPTA